MFSLTLLLGGLLLILVIGAMVAVFLLNRSWGSSLDRTPQLDADDRPGARAEPALRLPRRPWASRCRRPRHCPRDRGR